MKVALYWAATGLLTITPKASGWLAPQEKRVDDSMNIDADREVAIFTEALKVSPHERGALLDRLCGTDEDLRRKVEKVLRAHDRLGNFMKERPTGESID